MANNPAWPSLPYHEWKDTYATLHMWTQIVGKTRLQLCAHLPQWWQVAFFVTARGLTTSAMPSGDKTFDAEFDFVDHKLVIRSSDGASRTLALKPRTVADFYGEYLEAIAALGLPAPAHPVPVEVAEAIPFAEDTKHASYDPDAAHRHWLILTQANRVMQPFRGEFIGKVSPVHFFWGSFDLAVTRFSGRVAPKHPGGAPNCPDWVMRDAYSHEVSSAGFWPGNEALQEPAFYSYAYPAPTGFSEEKVRPSAAYFDQKLGEFVLPYEAVRTAADPDRELRAFLEDTYTAAAKLGKWDELLTQPMLQH